MPQIPLSLIPLHDRRIDLLLRRRAAEIPGATYLVFPAEASRMTYGEALQQGLRHAALLHGIGLGAGDHVGLMLPNCSDWVRAWFGVILGGMVDVGLHHELSGLMLAHQLRTAAVKAVLCDPDAAERVLAAAEPRLKALILRGEASPDLRAQAQMRGVALHALDTADGAEPAPAAERSPHGLMSIRFTSGTTGPSKAATLSMSQVAVWADGLVQLLGFSSQDRIYAPFPLHHHLASVMGVLGALMAGGSCIVDRSFSASRFWATAIEHRATLGLILDPVVKILLTAAPSPLDREHAIRRFYIARPNAEFERRFGARLQTAYALTEASILTYVPAGESVEAPNCVGYANPHFDLRVVDEDDQEVPPGTKGEIVFRPRQPGLCMDAYYDNPAATVKALRNYWFHTGDLGSTDDAGRFYFFERLGDTIRRRGVNIPSFHIEEVAMAFPGVKEAAAVGVPATVGEFEIKLCLTEQSPGAVTPEALTRWMAGQLPREMVPRWMEIREEFDRTITQKILKRSLRDQGITAATVATDQWLEA